MGQSSTFRERVQVLVKRAGGVAELARRSQMSERSIRGYLAGDAMPRSQALARLAGAAGVRTEWLETGEGKPSIDMSAISRARDVVVKFATRRSTVPESEIPSLMEEVAREDLELETLEERHGRKYPVHVVEQAGNQYRLIDSSLLSIVITAIEDRMPLAQPSAKAAAITALYEHAAATGKRDKDTLQRFLDLLAGIGKGNG